MYYFLSGAINNRMIKELRSFWQSHPKYREDLPKNIKGKFSMRMRPQRGIIVKNSGGNLIRHTWDNYKGEVNSYIALAKVAGKNSISIEWVREDVHAIRVNGGVFPSLPGVYYVKILEVEPQTGVITFEVKSYINVFEEHVYMDTTTTGMLTNPFIEKSLKLYQYPEKRLLLENVNYIPNGNTGEITLISPLPQGKSLYANYKYEEDVRGPYQVKTNYADTKSIPGASLAFGRRAEAGDECAILISRLREPAYKVYGGIWEVSLDLDFFARDVHDQREMIDYTANYMWTILRPQLDYEGINMTEISIGGESEDAYDDNADDYYYLNSISTTIQMEWEVHHPIVGYIERFVPYNISNEELYAGLTDEEMAAVPSNLTIIRPNDLIALRDPFFYKRNIDFEMIK